MTLKNVSTPKITNHRSINYLGQTFASKKSLAAYLNIPYARLLYHINHYDNQELWGKSLIERKKYQLNQDLSNTSNFNDLKYESISHWDSQAKKWYANFSCSCGNNVTLLVNLVKFGSKTDCGHSFSQNRHNFYQNLGKKVRHINHQQTTKRNKTGIVGIANPRKSSMFNKVYYRVSLTHKRKEYYKKFADFEEAIIFRGLLEEKFLDEFQPALKPYIPKIKKHSLKEPQFTYSMTNNNEGLTKKTL
ncbi:hypothetical protein R4B61_05740 [Fructilactobacillus vespulae]|uniref:hypothetical protein n=1 Tax=Fructilactobacillus vespulae TaxID=1249630 RepID=UPI0039B67755